jgi:hypothetical protein
MTQEVYAAINAVQADLAKVGITKSRRNSQGSGYNFRGIDDVYNSIAPLLAQHKLCILPRVLSRNVAERTSKQGGALFYITVEAEFDFVSAIDGSKHTVKTFGEAMDSGDKGTNKAMSAAYKYAAFQAFSIPTEAEPDADEYSPEVMATDAYGEFEAANLPYLREAAMNGIASLTKQFQNMAAGTYKTKLWAAHSKSLKAAAADADEVNSMGATA